MIIFCISPEDYDVIFSNFDTPDFVLRYWPWVTAAALFLADFWATCHIVLNKRDSRSALGWVGLIWFVPGVGPILYWLFGINRVERKAKRLRRRISRVFVPSREIATASTSDLQQLIGRITGRPLTTGNRVKILVSGEAAYTEMLACIEAAECSIGLSSYIFDNDASGQRFAEALARAVQRGVAVRVLIDDIGVRYSFPSIIRRLRKSNVPVSRFLPSLLPWRFAYAQMRNHRKILVVDGRIGFTGGMNIRDGHDARTQPRHPIIDCHFRIEGPVVNDLRAVFADDWLFTTGERLVGVTWFPPLVPAGTDIARGIASGPDDDVGILRTTFLGAIACARTSIRIVSPYFVPDSDLISALRVAALRGIRVEIILPANNNLRLVHWAMMGQIGQLLETGCTVWLTTPMFDHSKLLLIDDEWSLVGSANWDARSLRLNFEFDVECTGTEFSQEIRSLIEQKLAAGRALTLEEWNRRNLLVKLRDGVARLALPYL